MMPKPGTRVLLVDSSAYFPSNPLFAEGLEELARERGYEQRFLDEADFFRGPRTLPQRVIRRLAGQPLAIRAFNREFIRLAETFRPHIAIVVKGTFVAVESLTRLRAMGVVLVNFATDDPFSEPSARTPLVRAGIPHYDLYCSQKTAIIPDLLAEGARRVEHLACAYKPTVHFPEGAANAEERARFACDVSFIGGADDDRAPYFHALTERLPGVELHLYGGYWQRHGLGAYARGYVRGREYRVAMAETKIAVNLVRRRNRDGHTMRTFEIPACKGFMLAERTAEHAAILEEDRELGCFGSIDEFVAKIAAYLPDAERRREIAEAGYERITAGPNTYCDRVETILAWAAPSVNDTDR